MTIFLFLQSKSTSALAILDEKPRSKNGKGPATVPCPNCGRPFDPARVQTHAGICVNTRERDVFNISMKRVQGTEAEELVNQGVLEPC